MSRIKKILIVVRRSFIRKMNYINVKMYMRMYTRFLRRCGVKIEPYDGDGYIDPTVWIDGSDYGLINIGKKVTISREVMLLTHDYSIRKAFKTINANEESKRMKLLRPITIKDNVFVGARTTILPGAVIGENSIIGAGSIVKGEILLDSVYAGVPAKRICSVIEYAKKWKDNTDIFD